MYDIAQLVKGVCHRLIEGSREKNSLRYLNFEVAQLCAHIQVSYADDGGGDVTYSIK
jgi:hypothetical protein